MSLSYAMFARFGKDEFLQWRHESSHRTTYFLDVRTHDEYVEGHVPGTKHIAGGQLIQETDRHLAVWGARVVLFDNDGVRATLTASWLKQMGWDVVTVTCDVAGGATEQGTYRASVQGLDSSRVKHITPAISNRSWRMARLQSSISIGAKATTRDTSRRRGMQFARGSMRTCPTFRRRSTWSLHRQTVCWPPSRRPIALHKTIPYWPWKGHCRMAYCWLSFEHRRREYGEPR